MSTSLSKKLSQLPSGGDVQPSDDTYVVRAGVSLRAKGFAPQGPIGPIGPIGVTGPQGPSGVGATDVLRFVIEGNGSVISGGIKGDLIVPFSCQITAGTLLADQSGSIVVDVWRNSYANYPPTVSNSITGSAPLTITSAVKSRDSNLTGWSVNVAAGDVLRFNVNSASSVTRVTVELDVTKTGPIEGPDPFSLTFATRAAAVAANISSAINIVRTQGYYALGDGGQACYRRVVLEPAHNAKFQSADGTWWTLSSGSRPNVRMLGAKGDGVNDDAAAIQNTIDWAIYFGPLPLTISGERIVRVPVGNFLHGTTIHLGYGVNPQFTSVTLEGDGPRYDHTSQEQTGAALIANFSDRMAINVQGARQSRIKRLTLVGQYTYILSNNLGQAANDNDWNESTWRDPGFAASAFSAKSVYAGIAVDGYSGPQPGTHYPDVTYPSFLGAVSQYNKATSSDVLFEDVNIVQFVAAVAGHPCTSPGNGEFFRWRGGRSFGCLRGWCLGQSQSRVPTCEDIDFSQSYIAIDNAFVGDLHGMMQGVILGCHFGGCFQILNVETGFSSSVCLRDCYGEVIGRLGTMTAVGDCAALTLDNTTFDFREIANEQHGVPYSHVNGTDAKLYLINGTRLTIRYAFIAELAGTTSELKLDGSLIVMANVAGDSLPAAYPHGTGGILATLGGRQIDCRQASYRSDVDGQYYCADQNGWNGPYAPYFAVSYNFLSDQDRSAAGGLYRFAVPEIHIRRDLGATCTLTNRSGKTVDYANTGFARTGVRPGTLVYNIDLGDVLKINDAWFVVTGFSGADVTHLKQLSNYRLSTASSTFINKSTSDAANAHFNDVIISRLQVTGQYTLRGVAASGSGVVTSVAASQSASPWSNASHSPNLAADDYACIVPPWGGGFMLRLSSLDDTAKTLTFPSFLGFDATFFLPFWLKTLTP